MPDTEPKADCFKLATDKGGRETIEPIPYYFSLDVKTGNKGEGLLNVRNRGEHSSVPVNAVNFDVVLQHITLLKII
jgi:hypothetical protein